MESNPNESPERIYQVSILPSNGLWILGVIAGLAYCGLVLPYLWDWWSGTGRRQAGQGRGTPMVMELNPESEADLIYLTPFDESDYRNGGS